MRRIIKALQKSGWIEIRQNGSHKILRKYGEAQTIVLPYHRGKEIPKGTALRIRKQAGIK